MTINATSNYDYNSQIAREQEFAARQAHEVNSAKAIEAIQGVSNQEYYTPVEAVEPVSYADTNNVDMSASTANFGNLTPEMERLIFPAPTPTSSSPTQSQQTSSEPRSANSSDYNPAEEMREQVRAMRNTRPPESGESIAAARSSESYNPSTSTEIKEKFDIGSTEGRSESDKVLNRVA